MNYKKNTLLKHKRIYISIMTSSLNNYKHETMNIVYSKKWNGPSIEQVWLYLTEEIGELAGSIRRHTNQFRDRKKVKIESELGDVFSYLFQLSDMLDIDLDNMWTLHQKKMLKKSYQSKFQPNYTYSGHNTLYVQNSV